ncbi:Pkinase-domain-containing protein [Dendrothele bispora CBS 962.96]|uniref:Pkinase-domain-containing protein n=1 Tax=Dendrothele bispora (strain CBS 962.96) TaxID=1314807 RepID=A0A4S8LUU6_DENBC|nr:Pkinase-domain-containing protein [Dendrothele bispora CBS 962.96]
MSNVQGHKHSGSVTQNQKAHLANAYNELGRELSSTKIRVIGNYTLGKVIGEGAYGKVRLGTHRLTGIKVAIKQIPKALSASLTREIHHHRQLHHPHVTQMYEVIATENNIWIVTELCSGGELFDYLAEKGRLSEEETKFVFGQLCLAVAYLHDKGIVHRDLKLENVLLDEHCRVKLGDFGFTREFERGGLMETFCGTTGYAAPEMLSGKKYQGPEVDVWSLGVILYCLLTGMLPFDDDDEGIMRDKVVVGEFEDPEWLSPESRDLIKNVLVLEPSRRLTIAQILAHSWFTTKHHEDTTALSPDFSPSSQTAQVPPPESIDSARSSASTTSDVLSSSEVFTSAPTTPDPSSDDPFEMSDPSKSSFFHRNPSETTIRKSFETPNVKPIRPFPETVAEEEQEDTNLGLPLQRQRTSSSGSRTAPPMYPARTPARTKRRSVSSTLSENGTPSTDKTQLLVPQKDKDVNFASLLTTPAPIIFSTPLERELLNMMSMLGFDLGQIVYSVLNDACDAAGAVWWMLKRRAEKKMLEDGLNSLADSMTSSSWVDAYVEKASSSSSPDREKEREKDKDKEEKKSGGRKMHSMGVQVDPSLTTKPAIVSVGTIPQPLNLVRNTPQLAFVPATPTFPPKPSTPPRTTSPTSRSPMLTPSSSVVIEPSSKPSTPSGSGSQKGRKNRAGSVSIMQRATTALEAAGLVRKKSSEAVREAQERDKEKEKDKEKIRENERKATGGSLEERPRSSHGSGSSKLTKSPPLKASHGPPSTPPPSELQHSQPQPMDSPWVMAEAKDALPIPERRSHVIPATPANSPGADLFASASQPNLGDEGGSSSRASTGSGKNRANLLTVFRLWFHEDRKGKRKENSSSQGSRLMQRNRSVGGGSGQGYPTASVKRRTSNNSSGGGGGGRIGRGGRRNRPSVSSRRSSSVNSRRSSIASVQMVLLDSPQAVPGRRSFGSHTPSSDKGDYSSRPSSVRSFSLQPRHRRSPSAGSTGSVTYRSKNYHRRGGSGSSTTTRVVRQSGKSSSSNHMRSNSTTSSIHSPVSSRPTSYIEYSDYEGQRTGSPYKMRKRTSDEATPKRSREGTTTFIAQKKQGPFASPMHGSSSIGRSSWKKSWGLEPPGWQTRKAHLPVEVLAISPAEGTSLRDVFSGRHSLNLGDESDWVDEDDDIPYAGGLGQMTMSLSASSLKSHHNSHSLSMGGSHGGSGGGSGGGGNVMTLDPAPMSRHRSSSSSSGSGSGKRANKGAGMQSHGGNGGARQKAGHTPATERGSPVPGEGQLPGGRSGPAFKQPIQEEDEEEEEE